MDTNSPLPIDNLNPAVDANALNMGVFTGFKMRQPEYAVITPQNLDEFTVRSLTVAEEQALRGTMTTPRKLPEHLNSILWDCIIKKPEHIKTFNDFKKYVTLNDREALLYGLYHVTYKDISNHSVTCTSCQESNNITLKVSDIFSFTGYPGSPNEILKKRVDVKLDDVEPRAIITLKSPTILDEQTILNSMLFQSNEKLTLGMDVTVIDILRVLHPSCQVDEPDLNDYIAMNQLDALYSAYSSLPPSEKKKMLKVYKEEFDKYGIKLSFQYACKSCGHSDDYDIDISQQFFRAMYE